MLRIGVRAVARARSLPPTVVVRAFSVNEGSTGPSFFDKFKSFLGFKSPEDVQREGFKKYQETYRKLSGFEPGIATFSTPEELVAMSKKNVSDLSIPDAEELGRALFLGHGVEKDVPAAVRIWEALEPKGSMDAKMNLAACYRDGVVYPKNVEKALKMYQEAADALNPLAMHCIGLIYYTADGVEQNYETAIKYFQDAVDHGYIRSNIPLGNCYVEGLGVAKDEAMGAHLMELAAAADDPVAKHVLASYYYRGIGVPENHARAFELQYDASMRGHPAAHFNLAMHYMKGEGTEKNVLEAAKYFELAMNNGILTGGLNLVQLLRGYDGHPKDYLRAMEILNTYKSKYNVGKLLADVQKEYRDELANKEK